MRLEIDTTEKIIRIINQVNLGELTAALEKLLPNGEWKDYKLEATHQVLDWTSPDFKPTYLPSTTPDAVPLPWVTTSELNSGDTITATYHFKTKTQ